MKFEGSLLSQIERFRSHVRSYYSYLKSLEADIKEKMKFEIRKVNNNYNFLYFLKNKKVVGVDGSQILPLRELGIPIGLIQVAKVCILHGLGKFEVKHYSALTSIEENIDLKRFKMEVEVVMEECEDGGWLFLDGPLYPAFIVELNKKLREEYLAVVNSLLKKTKKYNTPVIGYIDKSFAKDLSKKFGFEKVYDSHILSTLKLFSYTQPFETEHEDILFSYVKLNPSYPARIEFPKWMVDMHDEVIKVVIAECLLSITKGYPYILERAHKYALIKNKEKLVFMEAVGCYDPSFKWISKIELTK